MTTSDPADPSFVRRAGMADRHAVVATVVAAFERDPAFRFFFPHDVAYPQQATSFVGYLFDKRVVANTVWMTDGAEAVSLWSPAGGNPHGAAAPEVVLLREEMLGAIGREAAGRLGDYDDAVSGSLPVDEPYWYLGVLACHPAHVGRGLGGAVMRVGLGAANAERRPAYLETTNPGNVGYYERAGWRVTAAIAGVLPITVWVLRSG